MKGERQSVDTERKYCITGQQPLPTEPIIIGSVGVLKTGQPFNFIRKCLNVEMLWASNERDTKALTLRTILLILVKSV